ncbi:Predicted O-methyltransferase YrrM [Bosea lupini]|uniref:Predicted O-methyltransferase YrrM n=1 Tax=Bosea lupini TaxID=1036779 RepID=A0A1H7IV09_9HYPH|nr:class I SAM-dependent methyltransferase [Bosea lupini]SEK64615.1 Predicted O-methyltransferase YrrM [Bosea lupini]
MRQFLKAAALAIPEVRRLYSERDQARAELESARSELALLRSGATAQPGQSTSGLQILEGTPYSRYGVPIEYLPSRDFAPRWGYSQPRIPSLDSWFRAHASDFNAFLGSMRELAPQLARVPLEFDEAKLPLPAWGGVPYCAFDALTLYTMIRTHKPKRYLEIGSGITTCFAKLAVQDGALSTKITSIDPEPRAKIDAICDEIVRYGLETCDLSVFDVLEAGDILFFDGSHRTFMNSDVTVFFIDILPRIKPGVIVHIHDIALPWDYDTYFKNWYWNEAYMLAVYMMGNQHRITPLMPTGYICRDGAFESELANPFIDLGKYNDGWRGGGAMWFTHKA